MSHFIMYLDQWCMNLERSAPVWSMFVVWSVCLYQLLAATLSSMGDAFVSHDFPFAALLVNACVTKFWATKNHFEITSIQLLVSLHTALHVEEDTIFTRSWMRYKLHSPFWLYCFFKHTTKCCWVTRHYIQNVFAFKVARWDSVWHCYRTARRSQVRTRPLLHVAPVTSRGGGLLSERTSSYIHCILFNLFPHLLMKHFGSRFILPLTPAWLRTERMFVSLHNLHAEHITAKK